MNTFFKDIVFDLTGKYMILFCVQAEDGKTEMSLVHFTITNPGWKPSLDSEKYLTGIIRIENI